MKCKYDGCKDSYISHAGGKERRMCRLAEWKRKSGVCPYDSKIHSKKHRTAVLREKGQKTLED